MDVENDSVVLTKFIPDNDPITELLVIADAPSVSEELEEETESSESEDLFDSFF